MIFANACRCRNEGWHAKRRAWFAADVIIAIPTVVVSERVCIHLETVQLEDEEGRAQGGPGGRGTPKGKARGEGARPSPNLGESSGVRSVSHPPNDVVPPKAGGLILFTCSLPFR